jgi:hypothetical protein
MQTGHVALIRTRMGYSFTGLRARLAAGWPVAYESVRAALARAAIQGAISAAGTGRCRK